jgi:hypothetical protein
VINTDRRDNHDNGRKALKAFHRSSRSLLLRQDNGDRWHENKSKLKSRAREKIQDSKLKGFKGFRFSDVSQV